MVHIKERMLLLVDHALQEKNLKDIICQFINFKEKEGFRFGELVLFHYDLFGGKNDEINRIAAGMELLILAIDIFDDLADQDNENVPWMKIAPQTAVHIATILLTISQIAIDESNFDEKIKNEAKKMFNKHLLRCISGQERETQNNISNEMDYFNITKEKSGSLISCACLLGTIFANGPDIKAVKEYAEHFGIAVQIANDIRDIQRENTKNDFLHKKKTLPILYLLNILDPQFSDIRLYYEGKITFEQMKAKQKEIISIIKKSGAIEFAQVYMELKMKKVEKIINFMNISEDSKKKILSTLFR
ncbi:polyprenyl synthetase family protein [Calidifontibacillus erzurumensis]|uniref:Polyprenyl synthetase family protein n=1 Tax=Calidifontibacillus erzurumensis TaxID=2741433 RepID=A0A8J8GF35_9BACI|nr:polyprenyl synthetase family protein [Calidifontibacillus erzurumensis]NSL51243.1 polyprenyl synthetase family protein [Calidifontibacillus erzurumensis]